MSHDGRGFHPRSTTSVAEQCADMKEKAMSSIETKIATGIDRSVVVAGGFIEEATVAMSQNKQGRVGAHDRTIFVSLKQI